MSVTIESHFFKLRSEFSKSSNFYKGIFYREGGDYKTVLLGG